MSHYFSCGRAGRVEDFIFFVDPSVETYDSLSRKFLDRLGKRWRGSEEWIHLSRRDYTIDLSATVKWSNGTWNNVDWNEGGCQWKKPSDEWWKKTLAENGIKSGDRAFSA